jgi:poly(hydroxyalkanoate) granule-associated protein
MALNPMDMARRGALAYVGAIALTSDQVAKMFAQFTARGGQVEKIARQRFASVEQAARKQVNQAIRPFRAEVEDTMVEREIQLNSAANTLENGRDRLLTALNLPTHADVLALNAQLEQLNSDLDGLHRQTRRQRAELASVTNGAAPMPGYEKLNAEAVVDWLPSLEEPALLAVRAYEQEHGNRVTVLRAVERALIGRQAARGGLEEPATRTTVDPLPRYDELTAEEVVERLHGLDQAELLHVKVYEQEHGNRVTVLRAVEDRLVASVEA